MEKIAQAALHGGRHEVCRHNSAILGCEMAFAVFIPPTKGPHKALYFLSGLPVHGRMPQRKQAPKSLLQSLGLRLFFQTPHHVAGMWQMMRVMLWGKGQAFI